VDTMRLRPFDADFSQIGLACGFFIVVGLVDSSPPWSIHLYYDIGGFFVVNADDLSVVSNCINVLLKRVRHC
jgi:hypothetical protein